MGRVCGVSDMAFTQSDSGGGGLVVDPEGDPGEDGEEDGRQIGLQHEVADVPLQQEAQGQSRVRALDEQTTQRRKTKTRYV